MAKMYLEINNGGYDILITDENGHWWYSELTNGYYGDANVYCDGETEEERISAALENLRREIAGGTTYSADDYIEEVACNESPNQYYDGKMSIDEIDNVVNYETNSFGDLVPINHDVTEWYEV